MVELGKFAIEVCVGKRILCLSSFARAIQAIASPHALADEQKAS
jgi:hypothetical protein